MFRTISSRFRLNGRSESTNDRNMGEISDSIFRADVDYLEERWQRLPVGGIDLPVIDIGDRNANAVVFVPILAHLEFVYARQIRSLSQSQRVILYRRREDRQRSVGLVERAEELRQVLDALGLAKVDLVGHGDAAMVLFEFALCYPERCRSLCIIAQGADYRIAPHPLIWWLHDLFLRLPVEHILPAAFLRRIVINYITAHAEDNTSTPMLPRHLIEEQFKKIEQWPCVYKFSVLPIIHYFNIEHRVKELLMPVLLINRADDTLSPEAGTRWLAEHLPNCVGYHVIAGRERFFMYSHADAVTSSILKWVEKGE